MKSETKTCQNCQSSFEIDASDFDFYEKIDVPAPTLCVQCREIRRIMFRNERALYKRRCDLCKEEVISRVSPDKQYPMYCRDCWFSDKWNPLDYAQEYDYSRPFFEQFKELLMKTPHVSLLSSNNVNSEWVNLETDVKNCYLTVGGHFNENSAYTTYAIHSKETLDSFWALNCELCYECITCERCYKTLYSQDCFDCRDTVFSHDCHNCDSIIGCAGLRNKKYHIFNKQVSKEEYHSFLKENPLGSRRSIESIREQAFKTWSSVPNRFSYINKSKDVTGHQVINSKNSYNVWLGEGLEDCKNLIIAIGLKDSMDGSSIGWGERVYESAFGGGFSNIKFSAYTFGGDSGADKMNSSFLEYCYSCPSSNNSFGCANFRKAEYCILNKKYTKEEYGRMVEQIKRQMKDVPYTDSSDRQWLYGEFFPYDLSPFGYNETTAQDYYPIDKDEARKRGYSWCDYEHNSGAEVSDYDVPDHINDVDENILKKILKCGISNKPYRIIPEELQFYRKIGIPVPTVSPLERHRERIRKLLPRNLFLRKCQCAGVNSENNIYENTTSHLHHGSDHCSNEFQTPYSTKREEIVYCEQCYNAEVV